MARTISDREARAMAYRLVEEIETRAIALMQRNPACTSKAKAMSIVIEAMALENRETGNA